MDLFDKAVKKAKEVGSNVASTAANVGNTIGNVTREQSELAGLKLQRNTIDKNLEKMYAQIGKKYISYASQCDGASVFDVSDLISDMQSELDEIKQLDEKISQLEEQIRQNTWERERRRAQDQFDCEKNKLDKALAMDILTDEEYDEKLSRAQKKLDNFEKIRKIDMQYEMNIISRAEHDEKIADLLA